jgi:ubiquinone/menaquinone biosynthesis C-methylase UbiE
MTNAKPCYLEAPAPACDKAGWRGQFARPTGFPGWLVGHLMALKNKERSEWVISLLDIRPDDHVLEIGFGSGVDIRRAAAIALNGRVAGIDHSEEMVRQARRRNAAAIRAGRVDLRQAAMPALPYAGGSFDKVFSINSVQFWPDVVGGLQEVRRVLKPDGRIAIAWQPRSRGATEETARRAGEGLVAALKAAGFSEVRLENRRITPVSVVCALGIK